MGYVRELLELRKDAEGSGELTLLQKLHALRREERLPLHAGHQPLSDHCRPDEASPFKGTYWTEAPGPASVWPPGRADSGHSSLRCAMMGPQGAAPRESSSPSWYMVDRLSGSVTVGLFVHRHQWCL